MLYILFICGSVFISAMHASIFYLYFISEYRVTISCQKHWKSDICVANLGDNDLGKRFWPCKWPPEKIIQKWNHHTRKHIKSGITREYSASRCWYIFPSSSGKPATRGPTHFVCCGFWEPLYPYLTACQIAKNLSLSAQLTWIWGISLPTIRGNPRDVIHVCIDKINHLSYQNHRLV